MSDWRTVPISDLCEAIYDGPHATPSKTDDGPIFLGISNLEYGRISMSNLEHVSEDNFKIWTRRVTPQADDIVFSYETRLGEAALIPHGLRCCLGRRMALMRPDKAKVYPRFLLFAYLAPEFQDTIRARTIHGSTVDRIPLIEFPSFPISVPDLSEQVVIASVLGALDDKIELNRRMNDTLEAMARTIFKDWFVDFGPVRAKVESRPPYLSPELWSLFPEAIDDNKPLGWSIRAVGEVIQLNPSERLAKGVDAPYLDMAALPVSGPSPDAPIQRIASSGSRFRNGDTLFARITPCLENGKTAYVTCLNKDEVGWGSTEFIVMRPKPPMPPQYGYLLARDEAFRTHAIQSMTGTSGRQRAQVDALARYEVPYPDEAVAKAFGELITPWFDAITANSMQSETLAQLRNLLLPKLMSGKIRLKDAEKQVESVL